MEGASSSNHVDPSLKDEVGLVAQTQLFTRAKARRLADLRLPQLQAIGLLRTLTSPSLSYRRCDLGGPEEYFDVSIASHRGAISLPVGPHEGATVLPLLNSYTRSPSILLPEWTTLRFQATQTILLVLLPGNPRLKRAIKALAPQGPGVLLRPR